MTDFLDGWRRAITAELCWCGPAETPQMLPVVPLESDGVACVALPYHRRELATQLREAGQVGFTVTDPRSAQRVGVAGIGPVELVDDLDGSLFTDRLLPQELRKHPPSRLLADTAMQRREHWWWLPRLVVRLRRVDRSFELPVRAEPTDALLVRDGTGLRLEVVRADDWDADQAALRALDGRPLRGDGAPTLVAAHRYSHPDLERWETWERRGTLFGDRLTIREVSGTATEPLRPLGLWQRIRRHRELRRACEAAIRHREQSREQTP